MTRLLPLALLLLVLPLAGFSGAGASHAPPPVHFSRPEAPQGALWLDLSGLGSQAGFEIEVHAEGDHRVGFVLLDPGAGWHYDVTARPVDGMPLRLDVRTAQGALLHVDPLLTPLAGATLDVVAPCDGDLILGGRIGDGTHVHTFGYAHDEACASPTQAQLLVWVAAEDDDATWTFRLNAPNPVTATAVEETHRATLRAAGQFAAPARASASFGLWPYAWAGAAASAGEAAEHAFEVEKGLRATFDGWNGPRAGLRATAAGPAGTLDCPCDLQAAGAGAWTFRVEGTGASAGGDLRLVAVDTSFPW